MFDLNSEVITEPWQEPKEIDTSNFEQDVLDLHDHMHQKYWLNQDEVKDSDISEEQLIKYA